MHPRKSRDPVIQQRWEWYRSPRWQRVRAIVLKNNPLCWRCSKPAEAVDHIEHRRDNATFWMLNNLRSACIKCNSETRTHSAGQAGLPLLQSKDSKARQALWERYAVPVVAGGSQAAGSGGTGQNAGETVPDPRPHKVF